MNDSDVFRANPEFICREIAGEFILVPVGKAAANFSGLASLNRTGLFLWKLLMQEQTFLQLWTALAQEYELAEELARLDTADFLKPAISRGIVLLC